MKIQLSLIVSDKFIGYLDAAVAPWGSVVKLKVNMIIFIVSECEDLQRGGRGLFSGITPIYVSKV
jgi:hypothetical protein